MVAAALPHALPSQKLKTSNGGKQFFYVIVGDNTAAVPERRGEGVLTIPSASLYDGYRERRNA
jgi:hypothetical protein